MTQQPGRPSVPEDIIDPGTIEGLLDLAGPDEPDLLVELIDLFLDDAAGRMRTLTAAFDTGDLAAVASAAHALKSASASMGALAFSSLCNEVESEARGGADVESLVAASRDAYSSVVSALTELRTSCA